MNYSDHRPYPAFRMEATDLGIVLRYGSLEEDGYGLREPIVFEHEGHYFMHYDGSDKTTGWSCYLATSSDLLHWTKRDRILTPAKHPDETNYAYDRSGAIYNYPFYENGVWHGFYVGSNYAYTHIHDVLGFPYLTLKTTATSPYGPWKKEEVIPFTIQKGTYYETTASPGVVVKNGDTYYQFFSASVDYPELKQVKRSLSIARTKDLTGSWQVDKQPILPMDEQIENSAMYYQKETNTWFLFTNHVGIYETGEVTDGVWVYWTNDLDQWNPQHKAVVVDGASSSWSKQVIGAPSVIAKDGQLYIFYDGIEDDRISHYHRHIGVATLDLPIQVP